jgi:hypothetical protein
MNKEELVWQEVLGTQTVYEFVKDIIYLEGGEDDWQGNYEKARGLLLRIRAEGTDEESVILIGDTNLEGGVCDDCRDKSLVIGWSDTLVGLINSL